MEGYELVSVVWSAISIMGLVGYAVYVILNATEDKE
jgi:hypothetical protein